MEKQIDITRKSKQSDQSGRGESDARFLGKQVDKLKMQARFFSFGNLLLTLLVIGLAILLAWWTFKKINRSTNDSPDSSALQILPDKSSSNNSENDNQTKQQTFNFTPEEKAIVDNQSGNAPTKPAEKPEPAPIAKDSFKIRVLNGNGISQSAKKLKQQLSEKGFSIGATGNAKTFNYEQTKIYYLIHNEAQAELVEQALADRDTSKEEGSPELIGKDYQILIVVGRK